MITETDGLSAYEFKDYYVILQDFKFTSRENKDLAKIKKLGGKKCKKGLVTIVKIIKNFFQYLK